MGRRSRLIVGTAVAATAAVGVVVPVTASPALAAVSNVNYIGGLSVRPAGAVAYANGYNAPEQTNAAIYQHPDQMTSTNQLLFTMQVSASVTDTWPTPNGRSQVLANVISGPDAGLTYNCTGSDANGQVSCIVSNDASRGVGVDQLRFFVDKNNNGVYDSGEPYTLGQATYLSTPFSVTSTAASSMAQDTCTPVTVSLLDQNGRRLFNRALSIKLDQGGATTAPGDLTPGGHPDTAPLGFCNVEDHPELTGPNGQALTDVTPVGTPVLNNGAIVEKLGTITPTYAQLANGVTFGIRAHDMSNVSVTTYYDANGNGIVDGGDPVAMNTLTVNPGLPNGGTNLVVTATPPVIEAGHPGGEQNVIATVTNAAGNPVANAHIWYKVTGTGPAAATNGFTTSVRATDTDSNGQTGLFFPVKYAEVDTVTAFIDYSHIVGGTATFDGPTREADEPQVTSGPINVVGNLPAASISFAPTATTNGDKLLAGPVDNTFQPAPYAKGGVAIVPAHQFASDDAAVTFTATVLNRANNAPIPNAVVAISEVGPTGSPTTNGLAGVLASATTPTPTLPAPTADGQSGIVYKVANGNGQITVNLNPGALNAGDSNRDQYVYFIRALVLGTVDDATNSAPSAIGAVMYSNPDVNLRKASSYAGHWRAYFPNTVGSLSITPASIETQPGSTQSFQVSATDQFGRPAANVDIKYSIDGRNPLPIAGATPVSCTDPTPTDRTPATNGYVGEAEARNSTNAQGQLILSYQDKGAGNSDLTVPNTYDVIHVYTDTDNNGPCPQDGDLGTTQAVSATRTYNSAAAGANDPQAVEGGIGTPAEQFSGAVAPFNPVTSDDTAAEPIDVIHTLTAQTPVSVFFEARSADNTNRFIGGQMSIVSSGVGTVGLPNSGTPTLKSGPVTIGSNGFAQIVALSTATGVQTITATLGNFSKTVSITWTNTGDGRTLTLTPATATSSPTQVTPFTAKVTDVWNNVVAGQPITFNLTGPAVFAATNGTSGTVLTDATGLVSFGVKATGSGTITLTATASGAQFSAPANTPDSADPAGNSTATATINSTVGDGIPSSATLTVSPTGTVLVGTATTVTGVLKDASGAVVPGASARFSVTQPGVSTITSGTLTSNSSGVVTLHFTSNNGGTATVTLTVLDPSGDQYFSQSTTVSFSDPNRAPKPSLIEASSGGVVALGFQTVSRLQGLTVYFYRRSGLTGQVVPLGIAQVDSNGFAKRFFLARHGQILALYGKVVGATNIADPYSNNVTFKVN